MIQIKFVKDSLYTNFTYTYIFRSFLKFITLPSFMQKLLLLVWKELSTFLNLITNKKIYFVKVTWNTFYIWLLA